ncbi:MAG TPA: hypothetical protein PLM81_00080 [Ginsengibacter sp.]|nr:hypothetical protein [Ginsengibacter sp.]HRP16709.1 hypothetical protein [Ginsengibacter sp.]HRP44476.1 hypothetical protein [Ginsengibacter sp.]
MKTLHKGIALLLLLFTSNQILAQSNPIRQNALFRGSAEKLAVTTNELDKAFTAPKGTVVSFKFQDLVFKGEVVSNIKRYENLHTVIVRSATLDNSLLSISKRINDDQTISYVGRILNERSADGYELTKNADGAYNFKKIKTDELLQDF